MKYLITGGSGGLGKAIIQELLDSENPFEPSEVVTLGKGCDIDVDFLMFNETIISGVRPDVVIHCAGVNKIERHSGLTTIDIYEMLEINAISQFKINRVLLGNGVRTICHVISDAAWTPMTHSLAYNVSKAAQLMVMRQMAHEDKRAVIFGVSPGKIANTGMSEYIDNTFPPMRGMTYEQGRAYQLSRLRTGEMQPATVAKFIMYMVNQSNKHMHGQNYTIGG